MGKPIDGELFLNYDDEGLYILIMVGMRKLCEFKLGQFK